MYVFFIRGAPWPLAQKTLRTWGMPAPVSLAPAPRWGSGWSPYVSSAGCPAGQQPGCLYRFPFLQELSLAVRGGDSEFVAVKGAPGSCRHPSPHGHGGAGVSGCRAGVSVGAGHGVQGKALPAIVERSCQTEAAATERNCLYMSYSLLVLIRSAQDPFSTVVCPQCEGSSSGKFVFAVRGA